MAQLTDCYYIRICLITNSGELREQICFPNEPSINNGCWLLIETVRIYHAKLSEQLYIMKNSLKDIVWCGATKAYAELSFGKFFAEKVPN